MDTQDTIRRLRRMKLADGATLARTAMRDKSTREALQRAVEHGRHVYKELAGEDVRGGLGRVTRDARLHDEIGAFVRSAANALDTGVAAGRRRTRRRLFAILLGVAGIAAIAARKLGGGSEAQVSPPAPVDAAGDGAPDSVVARVA